MPVAPNQKQPRRSPPIHGMSEMRHEATYETLSRPASRYPVFGQDRYAGPSETRRKKLRAERKRRKRTR